MMKKILMAAALVAALALTGCAAPSVVSTPTKDAAAPAESKPEPTVQTPPPAGPDEGSREAPLPYGQEVSTYERASNATQWQLTVSQPFDATADILGENQFNEAPAAGNIYLAVPVHAVWQGTQPVTPWADFQNGLDFSWVTVDGVALDDEIVVQPWPNIMDVGDLYQGGAADFTVVFEAPAAAAGLVRVSSGGLDFFVGTL